MKNIASPFGTRYLGGHSFHKGIDISEGFVPVYGKPIYAASDGVVVSAINYANTSGYGLLCGN
ncbi:MAG: M23 family metallopeptidase [Acutalibacteraceae bacterium]